MLCLTTVSSAQNTAEEIVKQYIDLLNEWLGSPDNTTKHNNVLNMFQTDGRGSGIKDAIVEKYNKDSGRSNCFPRMYLCLFYDEGTKQRINVEIIGTLTDNSDKYGTIITAVLRYSGGISLTTVSDFWISGNKITGIVSNEREITELNIDKVIYDNPPIQHEEPENEIVEIDSVNQSTIIYEYVDLELPSGTLWATCNVGANNPWEYGDYFAWGETKAKKNYTWKSYKFFQRSDTVIKKYSNNEITILAPKDDAATINMGNDWRMPTSAEWYELDNNCNWEWTDNYEGSGHAGRIARSKINPNKFIFFPYGGLREKTSLLAPNLNGKYWSSSLCTQKPNNALAYSYDMPTSYPCYYGLLVRAVRSNTEQNLKLTEYELNQNEINIPTINTENFTYKLITVNGYSFKMVVVEGGRFWMGAQNTNPNEKNYDADASNDEQPVHLVELKSYYIGETEVTQRLWSTIMDDGTPQSMLPKIDVSWHGCNRFISKLNQKTGLKFRLPTEAEWEYAAKGGIINSNAKFSGSDSIDDVAVYDKNAYKLGLGVKYVKSKNCNALGIYDMSGNVWEWCEDIYGTYTSQYVSGENRVLRGGSWNENAKYARVTSRYFDLGGMQRNSYGFRLVLDLQ